MRQKNVSAHKQPHPSNQIININGTKYLVYLPFTIFELLYYLGFNKNLIVVDYNSMILDTTLWNETQLKNGDSLEILSIAGGG